MGAIYNVLLVDDEPGALLSLKYLLDWEQLGFTIAGEATNGQQALDLFHDGNYALVITDMKMPVLSGLDLIAQLRALSDVPIIIMSGYEDFSFAQKGLQMGVKDYLLKPVEEDDLVRQLKSVAAELENERMLDKKLHFGLSATKERIAREWANGFMNAEEVTERFKLIDIQVRERSGICCIAAELDSEAWNDSSMTDNDLQIKRFAARNVMEDIMGLNGCLFEESDMKYGIVLFSDLDEVERADVIAKISLMSQHVRQYAKIGITFGIGKLVHAMNEAVKSYEDAKRMLDKQFFFGKQSVISEERLFSKEENDDEQNWLHANELIEQLDKQDSEQLREMLAYRWELLAKNQVHSNLIKTMILELFIELFRLVREQGIDYEQLFNPRQLDYERIMGARSLTDLFQITWTKVRETAELIKSHRELSSENAVKVAKRLANERYADNISMKNIASQVYMNAAYLGQLFKAETGIGFNDYLFQVRMENAKRILSSTDMKVYEVAYAVGYNDLDWFYKKFKQHTGLSASEYRIMSARTIIPPAMI